MTTKKNTATSIDAAAKAARRQALIKAAQDGIAPSVIAAQLGLTEASVYRALKAEGLHAARGKSIAINRTALALAELETNPDMPINELAKKFAVSPAALYRAIRSRKLKQEGRCPCCGQDLPEVQAISPVIDPD